MGSYYGTNANFSNQYNTNPTYHGNYSHPPGNMNSHPPGNMNSNPPGNTPNMVMIRKADVEDLQAEVNELRDLIRLQTNIDQRQQVLFQQQITVQQPLGVPQPLLQPPQSHQPSVSLLSNPGFQQPIYSQTIQLKPLLSEPRPTPQPLRPNPTPLMNNRGCYSKPLQEGPAQPCPSKQPQKQCKPLDKVHIDSPSFEPKKDNSEDSQCYNNALEKVERLLRDRLHEECSNKELVGNRWTPPPPPPPPHQPVKHEVIEEIGISYSRPSSSQSPVSYEVQIPFDVSYYIFVIQLPHAILPSILFFQEKDKPRKTGCDETSQNLRPSEWSTALNFLSEIKDTGFQLFAEKDLAKRFPEPFLHYSCLFTNTQFNVTSFNVDQQIGATLEISQIPDSPTEIIQWVYVGSAYGVDTEDARKRCIEGAVEFLCVKLGKLSRIGNYIFFHILFTQLSERILFQQIESYPPATFDTEEAFLKNNKLISTVTTMRDDPNLFALRIDGILSVESCTKFAKQLLKKWRIAPDELKIFSESSTDQFICFYKPRRFLLKQGAALANFKEELSTEIGILGEEDLSGLSPITPPSPLEGKRKADPVAASSVKKPRTITESPTLSGSKSKLSNLQILQSQLIKSEPEESNSRNTDHQIKVESGGRDKRLKNVKLANGPSLDLGRQWIRKSPLKLLHENLTWRQCPIHYFNLICRFSGIRKDLSCQPCKYELKGKWRAFLSVYDGNNSHTFSPVISSSVQEAKKECVIETMKLVEAVCKGVPGKTLTEEEYGQFFQSAKESERNPEIIFGKLQVFGISPDTNPIKMIYKKFFKDMLKKNDGDAKRWAVVLSGECPAGAEEIARKLVKTMNLSFSVRSLHPVSYEVQIPFDVSYYIFVIQLPHAILPSILFFQEKDKPRKTGCDETSQNLRPSEWSTALNFLSEIKDTGFQLFAEKDLAKRFPEPFLHYSCLFTNTQFNVTSFNVDQQIGATLEISQIPDSPTEIIQWVYVGSAYGVDTEDARKRCIEGAIEFLCVKLGKVSRIGNYIFFHILFTQLSERILFQQIESYPPATFDTEEAFLKNNKLISTVTTMRDDPNLFALRIDGILSVESCTKFAKQLLKKWRIAPDELKIFSESSTDQFICFYKPRRFLLKQGAALANFKEELSTEIGILGEEDLNGLSPITPPSPLEGKRKADPVAASSVKKPRTITESPTLSGSKSKLSNLQILQSQLIKSEPEERNSGNTDHQIKVESSGRDKQLKNAKLANGPSLDLGRQWIRKSPLTLLHENLTWRQCPIHYFNLICRFSGIRKDLSCQPCKYELKGKWRAFLSVYDGNNSHTFSPVISSSVQEAKKECVIETMKLVEAVCKGVPGKTLTEEEYGQFFQSAKESERNPEIIFGKLQVFGISPDTNPIKMIYKKFFKDMLKKNDGDAKRWAVVLSGECPAGAEEIARKLVKTMNLSFSVRSCDSAPCCLVFYKPRDIILANR
eukprot:sb/3460895/